MGISRPHVPYRNSLMTMVLRDSLGGNCKTSMIANVNLAPDFLDESISTCRFAQRVAMISNKISVNEETDPRLVIERLKQQVRDLQAEVQLLRVRLPQGPAVLLLASAGVSSRRSLRSSCTVPCSLQASLNNAASLTTASQHALLRAF